MTISTLRNEVTESEERESNLRRELRFGIVKLVGCSLHLEARKKIELEPGECRIMSAGPTLFAVRRTRLEPYGDRKNGLLVEPIVRKTPTGFRYYIFKITNASEEKIEYNKFANLYIFKIRNQ